MLEAEANSKDKFGVIKNNISQNFHEIKAKIAEKEKKRGAEVIRLNE